MSTRRTRNNPSPSGLKSLPYGPQKKTEKRTEKKNKQVTESSITVQPSAASKKRSRPASKAADKGRPAKKRTVRSRQANAVQDESHDDADDADDDEEVDDMRKTAPSDPKPPPPSPPFRAAEQHSEVQQRTEEFSSEEQLQTEEFSSEEHHSDGHDLEEREPENHNTKEYHLQILISPKNSPKDHHSEHGSQDHRPQEHGYQDASPAPRPAETETQKSPPPYIHKRHYLTPKPRPKPAKQPGSKNSHTKSKNTEPLPKSVQEREDLFEKMFGAKLPTYNTGLRDTMEQGIVHSSSGYLEKPHDEQDDEDSDGSFSFLDEPKLTGSQLARWRREQKALRAHLETTPKSADRSETRREVAAKGTKPKPSTTISNFESITPPAVLEEEGYVDEEIILTRPDLIDATRSLIKWAERDETHRVPNAEQMEALLENFNAQESAKVTPRPTSPPSSLLSRHRAGQPESSSSLRRIEYQRHESESGFSNKEAVNGENSGRLASIKDQSEVPIKKQEPQTPAPHPQESRGFWTGVSAVKSIFTSPLHFFDRRRNQQDSPTATTNGNPVSGTFESAKPNNATNLASLTNAPSTPTPSRTRREKASQSERKSHGHLTRSKRPQTERHRHHRDQPKPPIHLRGLVSPSRIAEIHRKQDRLAEERRKRRKAYEDEAEAEDESNVASPSMPSSRTGEKRKRPKGGVRTPPAGPPGTFRVPSPGSSDDSSEEDEDAEPEATSRPRYAPIPVAPRRELVSDDWVDTSPFKAPQTVSTAWQGPVDFNFTYNHFPNLNIKPVPAVSEELTDLSDSSGSFMVPTSDYDSDSDEDVDDDTNKSDRAGQIHKAAQSSEAEVSLNQDSDSSVLQAKQWTQTPPPKPRPGNAQLPQFPPRLSAAEAAKARAEKFKPKQPSSLRNVTQMSPLQIEKENQMVRETINAHGFLDEILAAGRVTKEEWERGNAMQDTFYNYMDREVLSAVNAIPQDEIAAYPLPPSLSQAMRQSDMKQSEVEREVSKYFR